MSCGHWNNRDIHVVLAGILALAGCSGAQESSYQAGAAGVEAGPAVVTYGSLPERLEAYVAALNSGEFEAMLAFYGDGVTADFRSRRSEQEDREVYEMLTKDLGQLEIRRMLRRSPDKVTVTARSSRIEQPVQLVFDIRDERVDGVSIDIGGPPQGRAALPVDLSRMAGAPGFLRSLDAWLKEQAAEDRFSGAVLVARNGTPVFHNAYGFANRAQDRPNEITTAFDVGSITKFLTRVAVAQLLQAGKLRLDAKIADYLPGYPDREVAARVSIQQLLEHRSGLGDFFGERWESADKSLYIEPRDFFPLFAGEPLRFEPGERMAYSNAGYIVLGAIVEAASGESYADYLEQRVFNPAGMASSGFELRDGRDPALAVGYAPLGPDGALVPNLDMLPVRGCPAGSSVHTAEDLLRLDRALRAGELLAPEWTAWTYRSATVREPADYALGIAGGAPGVSAGFESNGALTVIVLSNFDPPMGEALARQLFQAMQTGPDA